MKVYAPSAKLATLVVFAWSKVTTAQDPNDPSPSSSPSSDPSSQPSSQPSSLPSSQPSLTPSVTSSPSLDVLEKTPPPSRDVLTPTPSPSLDPLTPTSNPLDLCGGVGSCSINPDPHYSIWSPNVWYDFQGGCDQYAIDNPILQVQIRTRPRNWYSTITQLAIHIKQTGEVFRIKIDGQIDNTITGTGLATYTGSSSSTYYSYHMITLGDTSPASYFRIYQMSYGISMTAYGCGVYFAGSEGMCGSWDSGGVKLKNGTTTFIPAYGSDQNALAESWKVEMSDSLLVPPSDICDPSSNCGDNETFVCDAIDRKLQAIEVVPNCTRTCEDIVIPQFRDQCEADVLKTGDNSFACVPEYEDPILADPADLSKPDHWCGLLALSDDDLFNFASAQPLGTYCSVSGPGTGACQYYVKGGSSTGIPLNENGQGTGCVDTRGSSCYYQAAAYDLTQEERDSMCTTSVVANAAAQLRNGIKNGRCMDDPDYFIPCVGAWDINYINLSTNFDAGSNDELTLYYEISTDRDYEIEILNKDCETPITGIDVALLNATRSPKSDFHEALTLSYDFDKAQIAGSSIWDSATNQIKVCQVVKLIIPGEVKWVVKYDTQVLTIDFDLSVDFEFSNSLEAGGGPGQDAGSTIIASYLEACKCDGVQSFTCDSSPLPPNMELVVCIRSTSFDFQIDSLDRMFVAQDGTTITIILDDQVREAMVTSREYVPGMNGVAVSTRLPPNIITFSADKLITVSGVVEMKLDNGLFGRKLLANDSARKLNENAAFEVNVNLAGGVTVGKDAIPTGAASSVKSVSLVSLGMIVLLALAM